MVSAAVTLRVFRVPVKPAGDWVKAPRVMAMRSSPLVVRRARPCDVSARETAKGRLTP
jgi:hypothetical protein